MARKIKTANEMFDLLGSMQGGSYVTICHVDYAKIDNPKKQIINPITKRKNSVVDFDTIGNNLGVQGLSAIISITRYRQLNWLPQSQLGAKYGAYRTQVNNIRKDFGVPEMKHKQSPYQTMKYGNGISVGNTPNIQGRAYTHQNTFNANKDVTYYGVDNIGHVLKKFTLEDLKGYLGNKRDINGLKQLQKLTQDQKVIDDYIKKILDLKMEYTTFLDDRIIYMIGSANNEKFFFTNDNLASSINDIPIRPSEFMAIARATYHTDYQIMNEQVSKYNMITENSIRDRHLVEFGLTQEDYENFMLYHINKLEEMYGENYEEYSERFDGYARKYMGMRENKYNKQNIIKENMKRQVIRLTESDLHRVIKESVKRVLKESGALGDRLNGGTNRAKFRDQDMKKDWEDAEPNHMHSARKRFNSLPPHTQQGYKDTYGSKLFQDPDNMREFTDQEMESDWDKFGNLNTNNSQGYKVKPSSKGFF